MKVLHLTLKKKWFDMILSDEKKEEYREIKEYWLKRFCDKEYYKHEVGFGLESCIDKFYDVVKFRNGYSKNARTILIECKGLKIDKPFFKWYGETPSHHSGQVFVIKLGKIIETNP